MRSFLQVRSSTKARLLINPAEIVYFEEVRNLVNGEVQSLVKVTFRDGSGLMLSSPSFDHIAEYMAWREFNG